jgi:YD repeat-containing protein
VGVGIANVVNLNFLVQANDVNIPLGELDLAFTRTYNVQSQHNFNNDDGSTPSVFGNKWTNNLDVHLGWQGTGSTGTVSVYTADGARDDYTCTITQVGLCTSNTPGVYDLLATTQLKNGYACQIQWTKKSGVSYIFDAPYQQCTSNDPGYYGRLLAIYGRNTNFSIQLSYSWSPNDESPENIAGITATHEPDGAQLTLTFATVAGSSPAITELMSITRPDLGTNNYHYDTNGNLTGVDKPGNNPVLPAGEDPATSFAPGVPIPSGNLPETYDVSVQQSAVLEVCGPRAATGMLPPNTAPVEGACIDFESSNKLLSAWWTRGVLNPKPDDGVLTPSPIQSGLSSGFVTWNDTAYFSNNNVVSGCGTAAEMSDTFGHLIDWCYDASSRVSQTLAFTSGSNFLTASQGWDSNNDLVSVTDTRGNMTNIAYDSSGNVVEISLPQQTNSQGTNRPTHFFDHDQYNNLTKYCDPANNPAGANNWNPNPGPTPCASSGNANPAKFTWNTSDPQDEPYGCLEYTYTPSGYKRAITYSGGVGFCGAGLPSQIQGATMQQPNDPTTPTRSPTLSYTYNSDGDLHTYNPGDPDGATWQISYFQDGMKRVKSITDPDGVTSHRCYNQDGSLDYSETAYQYQLDSSPTCTTGATPPAYAVGYRYDADGDVVALRRHHDCPDANNICAANTPAPTNCYSVSVKAGATCNFYDGLDRLVEVKLPYDSSSDLYTNPWITRYLYDLNGQQQSFDGQSFYAYGNLFETQELVAPTPTPSVYATVSPGSASNTNYAPIKAFAYDGLDRPVTVYSALGAGSNISTETLTWDTSPIPKSSVTGLLGQDCNSATPPPQGGQCQEFDYNTAGQLKTFESNDGSSPERDYTYDPDGRAATIASAAFTSYPQTYGYDVDGNLQTTGDAANDQTDHATLTYHRYADGMEKSLDVASGTLNQTGLVQYSYRNDGPLEIYAINDFSLGSTIKNPGTTKLSYMYTDAGRFAGRSESGAAAPSPAPTTSVAYLPNLGLVKTETNPVTTLTMTTSSYSAEGELTNMTAGSVFNCNGPSVYVYSLRGELTNAPPNCLFGKSSQTFMANGAQVRVPTPQQVGSVYSWNDLMAVSTKVNQNGSLSNWTYDTAGRMTSESGPYPRSSPSSSPLPVTVTRTYDAENHLNVTTVETPAPSGSPSASVRWGPDGHPITIAVTMNGSSPSTERLHWNGDQLLFTTNNSSGSAMLDDIKVDVQGDILPGGQGFGEQGYPGLTFYDRGPGGTALGCHNYTGTSYVGPSDSSLGFPLAPCGGSLSQGALMPSSTMWSTSPFNGGRFTPGKNTLGMPRPDGFTDGYDAIQGLRAFDSTSGSWTTPDAYRGNTYDPGSQKSYSWNNNDPINNIDPSGYDTLALGYWNAIQGTSAYHTFGIVFDDDGNIIHVYSFGPAGIFLNNDYALDKARSLRNSMIYFATCAGMCSWEARLNSLYYRWPNYRWLYSPLTNSNTALAWILHMAGLSTTLPQAPPWTPGWKTCSGGPTAWGCRFIPNTPPLHESVDTLSLDAFLYSIYGGIDPWLYYCNDCTNHFPGLPQ